MAKVIYFVIAEKGGIGKSLTTNLFASTRTNARLVDSDPVNPDIHRMNNSVIRADLLDRNVLLDFIQFAISDESCDEYIVSLPARALGSFIDNADILSELKNYTDTRLSVLFIIDAVNGVDILSNAKMKLGNSLNFDTVILNGGAGAGGSRSTFSDWDNSAVKNGGIYNQFEFTPFAGKEIFLEDLRRKPISRYLTKLVSESLLQDLMHPERFCTLPVMDRIILKQFHTEMINLFKGV